ncbi:MAG: hypothetical protein Q9227_003477 [Pyrenula ochraceoflavens]
MSKRRVKALDYEDEYDDEEDYYDDEPQEEQGPTAEDKEKLRQGAVDVRHGLGPDFDVPDKEIEEVLWYYYYDVGKSITYLKSVFVRTFQPQNKIDISSDKVKPKPAKKPDKALQKASESKRSQYLLPQALPQTCSRDHRGTPDSLFAFTQGLELPSPSHFSSTGQTSPPLSRWISLKEPPPMERYSPPFSAKEFFRDSPWLNIPQNRQANILIEPVRPQLGLLGGSGASGDKPKTSKLAALAAKRRQKENEKKASSSTDAGFSEKNDISSQLQSLRVGTNLNRESRQRSRKASDTAESIPADPDPPSYNQTSLAASAPEQLSQIPNQAPSTSNSTLPVSIPDAETPSTFASTLFGSQSPPCSASRAPSIDVASLMYGNSAKGYDFTEPSPDDKVLAAQRGSKLSAKNAKPTNEMPPVEGLSIQHPAPAKAPAKKVDVVAEYKKQKRKNAANFVVIGHVDSGKSTLMGRLLFSLNAVSERQMALYHREAERTGKSSFAFAWILDSGSEERERGVTMDIATNTFSTTKTNFRILDAPGHRDFVPNMIAGAAQADFAVLVIDSGVGEFESGMRGQTKEHVLLVRSMGVQKLIVAINKMDAAGWSQDRFTDIQQQTLAFLTTGARFKPENLTFIPCSGLQGQNILDALPKETDANNKTPPWAWYKGPTLIEALDTAEPQTFALESPLRMTISDVGLGLTASLSSVSGRIESGTLQTGDTVLVQPAGETATIKSLDVDVDTSNDTADPSSADNDEDEDHNDPATPPYAVAGQTPTLHLSSIDPIHLRPGSILTTPTSPIPLHPSFTAKLLVFAPLTPSFVTVHRGRMAIEARIAKLGARLDKSTGQEEGAKGRRKKVKIGMPGDVLRVVVEGVEEGGKGMLVEKGWKVVVRAAGETVGAGVVE